MLIIFDCDGVLVDSELIANRVLSAHLSRHGYPVTAAETQARFVGRTIPGVIDLVRESGVELPEDFETTLRTLDEAAFERELKPVTGIASVLEQLHGQEKCVASSGPHEKIRRNLELTGLIRYLDPHLFSARDVPHPKPAPDLFFHAANRMSCAPEQCIVIEDTDLGVTGAKRAGMRVIGFIGASHRVPADAAMLRKAGADEILSDMTKLPELLAQIN